MLLNKDFRENNTSGLIFKLCKCPVVLLIRESNLFVKTLDTGKENWAGTGNIHAYFLGYLQYLSIQLTVFLKILSVTKTSKNILAIVPVSCG